MTEKNSKIPRHIGIMIGGNEEWAKERNLSVEHGFLKSYELLKNSPAWFFEKGVKEISFALYLVNDQRKPEKELGYLMKQAKKFFLENADDFNELGYKILFSGETDNLPGDLADIFRQTMIATKDNANGILNFCFNYNGRREIVDAVKKIITKNFEADQISEALIKKFLYQNELPYPELIISTAGLITLSGFLLWQTEDSELISLNKYWPDFEKNDVDLILSKYNKIKKI